MRLTLALALATAGLAAHGAAAQGITLFGDARLGLGYNIGNDGDVTGDDELRAVSRVRFGVNMVGETDSGITFGATIRADNSANGQGGDFGQRAGNVFVAGSWGTLTFGDTDGADEHWVGDVPGNLSLTGLGDLHETIFISNGGDFGNDEGNAFASNPFARPTVRYDFDIAGFGISLSSNRDLTDIGVGAGYAADFGGGSWSVGVGYYDFNAFTVIGDPGTDEACFDAGSFVEVPAGGDCAALGGETVLVPGVAEDADVPAGKQWSVGLAGDYESFSLGVVYTDIEADDDASSSLRVLYVGGEAGFDAFTVGAYYASILGADGEIEIVDGDDSYGLTAEYDLGGGAAIAGGVARTFGGGEDGQTVADFGITMSF